ncbi:hypothetical protein SAMN05428642_102709 [Flaviramulus basaltis]|uniref:RiboL-PSP-HEPN domain-containing protein n=1 Tax=Flaviramulus basaltis TaxID=369401 RepID=A0A1K2IJ16_9FLAO|nr:hypothetical protein [Flaviramulus basaltis]SFZ92412.1 hypothetical protein SAMN05428642_102709 [Flaviramulus basaltis]
MIKLRDDKYYISVDSRLVFKEKLDYLLDVIKNISNNHLESEEDLETKFWIENGIEDATDLSSEDFKYYQDNLLAYLEKHKHFPQIQFKSLIVSIYSVLETFLNELTISTEKEIPRKIKYKNLRTVGSEIENYLNFFSLVYSINFSEMKEILAKLKSFADIRNNIVHKNGNIIADEQGRKNRIKKSIEKNKNIKIKENGQLFIMNDKFLIQLINLVNEFGLKFYEIFEIEK